MAPSTSLSGAASGGRDDAVGSPHRAQLLPTDLFGLEFDAEAAFVADNVEEGFDNHPERLEVSPLLVNQYRESAEQKKHAFIYTHALVILEKKL